MNKSLLAPVALLLALALHVQAQESVPDPSVGKWAGDWESIGGRAFGSMEMVIDVKGEKVFGQVKSTGSSGCSSEWETLSGVTEGRKVFAHYNLGGRCRKVEIVFSIDQAGKLMTGSWSSQYPGTGTFRLVKLPTPPAASAD